MRYRTRGFGAAFGLPDWVPARVAQYLAHTEQGLSIRALARWRGRHASTILRQIRRMEILRDDPLVDAGLHRLAMAHFKLPTPHKEMPLMHQEYGFQSPTDPEQTSLSHQAVRILRRLCENGAVLAVAADMDKAVVVRDGQDGDGTRTAVVDATIAQAMALKDWIACKAPGRVSRYKITQAGRAALSRMLAEQENQCRIARETGFAEAQTGFGASSRNPTVVGVDTEKTRRLRYNLADSPLIALSRRKDRDGTRFLSDDLVRAGERLREDFELSQIGPRVTQNWAQFLSGGVSSGGVPDPAAGTGAGAARDRVAQALSDLGPGLSDVVLRCCCYLEGLEMAEKRMGWSARSGKIVLRIALQRLKRFYSETQGGSGPLIG